MRRCRSIVDGFIVLYEEIWVGGNVGWPSLAGNYVCSTARRCLDRLSGHFRVLVIFNVRLRLQLFGLWVYKRYWGLKA